MTSITQWLLLERSRVEGQTPRLFPRLPTRLALSTSKARIAALGLIVGVAFILNLWLVSQDRRPPPWDYATYLTRSVQFYEALKIGSVDQFLLTYNDPYRPPLVSLMAVPFYAVGGIGYGSAMLVNLVFIAILVMSAYELGKILISPVLGLLSALAAATLPGIMVFQRVFGLDFPLTALVVAGACLTLASDNFNNRRISLLLGLILGLGMLTKWTYIIFVGPLIAWEIVRNRRRIQTRNAFTVMLIFLGISSTWYISGIQQGLVSYLTRAALSESYAVSSNLLDVASLLFYPSMMARNLGPVYWTGLVVFAGISSILLLRRRAAAGKRLSINSLMAASLLLSIVGAILVFTLLTNKSARFILPTAPIFVTLLMFVIMKSHRRFSSVLFIVLLAGSCVSIAGTLQPQIGEVVGMYFETRSSSPNYSYEYSPPSLEDWRLDQALRFVAAQKINAFVAVIADHHWVFNQDTLKYYALVSGFDEMNFLDSRGNQIGTGPDALNNFDVVFLKTTKIGDPTYGRTSKELLTRLSNPEDPFYFNWRIAETLDLPDQTQLKICVKIVPGSLAEPVDVSTRGHFDPSIGVHIRVVDATSRDVFQAPTDGHARGRGSYLVE